jgi:hypothetical protein
MRMAFGVRTERLLVGTPHAFFEIAGSVVLVSQSGLTSSQIRTSLVRYGHQHKRQD